MDGFPADPNTGDRIRKNYEFFLLLAKNRMATSRVIPQNSYFMVGHGSWRHNEVSYDKPIINKTSKYNQTEHQKQPPWLDNFMLLVSAARIL